MNIIKNYLKYLNNNYVIRSSPIHGNGIFSKKNFNKGEFINTHFDSDFNITEFGKFLNHSKDPNARSFKQTDSSYQTYAIKPINNNDEITLDYTVNPELEQPQKNWR